ncbi:MAG: tRNA pseudouridine(38-40) synthase TruA [Candidatus Thermoplasmatota archaeon]
MRIAIKFAYDGKKFHGVARQLGLRTVEGEIINVLAKKRVIASPKKNRFQIASRTDKNVSAIGNVFAFNTKFLSIKKIEDLLFFLNSHIDDCIFYGYKIVEHDFNPRKPLMRWYRYILDNRYNIDKIKKFANLFIGMHDFKNFSASDFATKRKIEKIKVSSTKNFIFIDFYAESFLYKMVRKIISGIIKGVEGKFCLIELKDALNCKKTIDFGLASAEDLILMDIIYPFDFILSDRVYNEMRKKVGKKIIEIKKEEYFYGGVWKILKR